MVKYEAMPHVMAQAMDQAMAPPDRYQSHSTHNLINFRDGVNFFNFIVSLFQLLLLATDSLCLVLVQETTERLV